VASNERSDERSSRLASLVAAARPAGRASRIGDPRSSGAPEEGNPVVAALARVSAVAVTEVGVTGAGVTVMGTVRGGLAGGRSLVYASSGLGQLLEDLQLTTGQGPCLEAFGSGAPVLVGDLDHDGGRWPGFTPEATAAGAAAVFSFPLQIGAARLGTMDLHRGTVGPLSATAVADALLLARAATELLLQQLAPSTGSTPAEPASTGSGSTESGSAVPGWLSDVHAVVHQATGMISQAHGVPVAEALLRLRARAFTCGIPISDVARAVVARDVDIDPIRDHDR
jgi:hypothetical protein